MFFHYFLLENTLWRQGFVGSWGLGLQEHESTRGRGSGASRAQKSVLENSIDFRTSYTVIFCFFLLFSSFRYIDWCWWYVNGIFLSREFYYYYFYPLMYRWFYRWPFLVIILYILIPKGVIQFQTRLPRMVFLVLLFYDHL